MESLFLVKKKRSTISFRQTALCICKVSVVDKKNY